jgi:CPA2 family monovalent cation:H+ antiporter-2
MAVRLIRKWTWQMALNLILVAGLFLIAAFVGRMRPSWLRWVPGDVEGFRAGLWLCSMLAAAPLAIATYRKLQALGMLLGELSAQSIQNERNATAIKAIISNTVLVAGSLGLGLLWLLLSTAVLPSGQVFLALALVLILSVVLLWRTFIRIYAKAQIALTETLSQPPPPRHEETPSPLAGLLREARIERITISAGSAAAGALIRQLALRTRTGTSVVAIERDGVTMVNPGPDDELQAGDQVLLLGSPQQVDAAREYLLAEA